MKVVQGPESARRSDSQAHDDAAPVGRRSLGEALGPADISPHSAAGATGAAMPVDHDQRTVAALAGPDVMARGGGLPHFDQVQRSFGHHDISHVQAYTGASAAAGSREIGAAAYARGNRIAFGGSPSLHTAAHEAAHVVQQGPTGPADVAGPAGATGAVDPTSA